MVEGGVVDVAANVEERGGIGDLAEKWGIVGLGDPEEAYAELGGELEFGIGEPV